MGTLSRMLGASMTDSFTIAMACSRHQRFSSVVNPTHGLLKVSDCWGFASARLCSGISLPTCGQVYAMIIEA